MINSTIGLLIALFSSRLVLSLLYDMKIFFHKYCHTTQLTEKLPSPGTKIPDYLGVEQVQR